MSHLDHNDVSGRAKCIQVEISKINHNMFFSTSFVAPSIAKGTLFIVDS